MIKDLLTPTAVVLAMVSFYHHLILIGGGYLLYRYARRKWGNETGAELALGMLAIVFTIMYWIYPLRHVTNFIARSLRLSMDFDRLVTKVLCCDINLFEDAFAVNSLLMLTIAAILLIGTVRRETDQRRTFGIVLINILLFTIVIVFDQSFGLGRIPDWIQVATFLAGIVTWALRMNTTAASNA